MNRHAIVSNALWGAAVAAQRPKQIHYGEVRPIRGASRVLPLTTDCSGFVTLCYEWAQAPDPNAMNYNGTGYTGSMLHACSHIQPRAAQLADLVVFGDAPGTHVVIIVQLGSDPMVVSHGSEDGPLKLPLSQEATSHPGQPLTYLSVAHPKSAAPRTPTKSASGGVAPTP